MRECNYPLQTADKSIPKKRIQLSNSHMGRNSDAIIAANPINDLTNLADARKILMSRTQSQFSFASTSRFPNTAPESKTISPHNYANLPSHFNIGKRNEPRIRESPKAPSTLLSA